MVEGICQLSEELENKMLNMYYEDEHKMCAMVVHYMLGYIQGGGQITNEELILQIQKQMDRRFSND
jgi:hypothetical protein